MKEIWRFTKSISHPEMHCHLHFIVCCICYKAENPLHIDEATARQLVFEGGMRDEQTPNEESYEEITGTRSPASTST